MTKAEALQASIDNWVQKRDAVDINEWEYIDDNKSCPLCIRYPSYECDGCPVRNRTGREDCLGTPYIEACRAFHNVTRHTTWENRLAWSYAAQQEIDFLRSLQDE